MNLNDLSLLLCLYTNWGWPGRVVVEGDQGHVVIHHLKFSAIEIHTVHFDPRQH